MTAARKFFGLGYALRHQSCQCVAFAICLACVATTTLAQEVVMNTLEKKPIEVVRAFNEAMIAMDFDEGLRYIAADCQYTNGPQGLYVGPEGVRSVLEPFFRPILENEFVILREAQVGNLVFMERLDRHRLEAGWIELPVTGVYEVKDGLIVYWRDYFDLATIGDAVPKP